MIMTLTPGVTDLVVSGLLRTYNPEESTDEFQIRGIFT
jgi:hypothetical protein